MTEKQVVSKIISCFHKGSLHKSNFFESDAEVVDIKNNEFLFTTDEFSSDDYFPEKEPYMLGRNIVVATLSDILACGGIPSVYGHSMVVGKSWSDEYVYEFSKGVASIVNAEKISFVGGDFGRADSWRYTGIALGCIKKRVARKGATPGDLIYMSGKVGIGNLYVAVNLYQGKLENSMVNNVVSTQLAYRIKESEIVSQFASACTDTSDGVYNAVKNITEEFEYGFALDNISICEEGVNICNILQLPVEILILGECGEYELLFTIPQSSNDAFLKEASVNNLFFSCIGKVADASTKKIKGSSKTLDFTNYTISARSFPSTEEYLMNVLAYLKSSSNK
jgi:thiamine-monophosphate kinase